MKTAVSFCTCVVFASLLAAQPEAPLQNPPPEVAEFRFSQSSHEELPSWVVHFSHEGGDLAPEAGSWTVAAGEAQGVGRLVIRVDREQLLSDLALSLVYEENEATDLGVQLLDSEGRVIVVDLFSNVAAWGRQSKTDTFIIPIQRYPEAAQVVVRRLSGPVKVFALVLYPVVGQVDFDVQSHLELARLFGDPLNSNSDLMAALKQSRGGSQDADAGAAGSVNLSGIGPAQAGIPLASEAGQPFVGHQLRKFQLASDGTLTAMDGDWRSSWLYLYHTEGRSWRLTGHVMLGAASYTDVPNGFALFVRESDSLHRYEISSQGTRVKRRLFEGTQVPRFAYPFRFTGMEPGRWQRFSIEVREDMISVAFGGQLGIIRGPLDTAGGNKLVLAPGAAMRDVRLSILD